MIPSRLKAEEILREAEGCNPGAWGDHSRIVAHCAESIARATDDMDPEKAYVLGLLHDVGRKFGVRHLGHVSDGYKYMMDLGYQEVARICLSHSFHDESLDGYIGQFDTSPEDLDLIKTSLANLQPDDYDALIRLCDALAGSQAILDIEERMQDVQKRYGSYPQEKWDANLKLKAYFEDKTGQDIYDVVGKETFRIK